MTIHVISLVERNGKVYARARATAAEAKISVEVWFERWPDASRAWSYGSACAI
jgi:hypothetical protein